MQTTLQEVKLFSKCPKRYWFLQNLVRKPISQDISIVLSVIKKAYNVAHETGYKIQWRRLINWVNKHVFKDVDVKNKESYESARKVAEHIIKFLYSWYHNMYLAEECIAYTDISLDVPLGSHLVYTKLPIVKIQDVPTIINISNINKINLHLLNDLEICGQMAFLSNEINEDKIKYEYIQMGEQGKYQNISIERDKKQHDRTIKMISDIVQSISYKVGYPAVTQQCTVCKFRRKCKI